MDLPVGSDSGLRTTGSTAARLNSNEMGLNTARLLLHLAPVKYRVYFHLAGMGRGHGEVAALSRRLGQGFSSACSQRSNYANGDRIWGWVRRLIRPRTLSKLLAVIPATTGTYSYSVHFKTQSPCWAVSGSQMRLHMDLFLSRLIVYHQEATNTISHLQKDRNIVSKLSLCLPPPLPRL